jgi:hypothetical protein
MPKGAAFKTESIGGIAVGLIAAALAGIGVPKYVWIIVLVVGVVLLALAIREWVRGDNERPEGDLPPFERREHKTRSENWEVTEWEETRRGRDVAIEAAAAGATAAKGAAAGEVQFPVSPDSLTAPSVSQGDVPLHQDEEQLDGPSNLDFKGGL